MRPGDTVWRIAHRHGVAVEEVLRRNRIEDVRRLPVGLELAIPVRLPPGEPEPGLRYRKVDALRDDAQSALREARFDDALAGAESALRLLEALPDVATARERRARLEVLVATVHVARDEPKAALESLRRALEADPALELDPATTSPKLLRVFYAARGEAGPEP